MASSPPFGMPPPRYRLPDASRIGAVQLLVSNLQRSIDYYERAIGLRVVERSDEAVTLGPHESDVALVHLRTRPGVRPARRGAFGLFHFAILLPDRPSLGRFAAHITQTRERVGMSNHLVSESIYLWDPDGLGIEVYADRPRATWQHRDRELVMATDPLDVDDVIAEGRGRAWTGAPAGTTMGHVHLSVGDLGAAEAFYHAALGFDKTVWHYPGALFLAAGGYHHHLGTNTWSDGPAANDDEARLLSWELVVPQAADASEAAASLTGAGFKPVRAGDGWTAADPWGTRVRLLPEHAHDAGLAN